MGISEAPILLEESVSAELPFAVILFDFHDFLHCGKPCLDRALSFDSELLKFLASHEGIHVFHHAAGHQLLLQLLSHREIVWGVIAAWCRSDASDAIGDLERVER